MRILLLLAFLIIRCQALTAAEPSEVILWTNGAPGAGGNDVGDRPSLAFYDVEGDAPRSAVIVLPGGGYGGLAASYEGHDVAQWFQRIGITGVVCRYRHRGKGNDGAGYKHPYPMLDAQRAIRSVRAESAACKIDPQQIGVLGFSAGGHLASTVATHFDAGDTAATDVIDRVSCRPDFAVLCYAVTGMGKPYTHRGSQRNLLGENPDPALTQSLSNESQVSKQTPPMFLFHTHEDTVVPPENAIAMYMACVRHGVPAELHIFQRGRHGVGLASDIPGARKWPMLCEEWLRVRGILKSK